MNTQQLKTLLAIVQKGTIAEAANVVSSTPSALSQRIHSLERELGVVLFDRTTRPPTLNAQGAQVVEVAESILASYEQLKGLLSNQSITGVLNIGSVRTSAFTLIPRAIVELRRIYPALRIRLRISNSEPLLTDVLTNRIDAAIVAEHMAIPKGLLWQPFIREPLLVIAPPGTSERDARRLLTQYPYIRFSSNVPLAHLIDTEIAHMGISPNETAEIDMVWAIASSVRQGLGVAVVPEIVFRNKDNSDLVSTPFGQPHVFRQIGLVQRSANPRRDLITRLHEQLCAVSYPYGVVTP